MLYGIGQGAVAPAIALSARELGASLGAAGLVVAVLGVGQIVGDVPAGALASRIGERRAMLLAVAVAVGALAGCVAAPSVVALAAAVFVLGLANSVFGLARQTYLSEVVPLHLRARALSTLGGTLRIGMFVGPFLAAPFLRLGGTDAAYALHLVVAVARGAGAARSSRTSPGRRRAGPGTRRGAARPASAPWSARHRRVLLSLGTAVLLVGAVRASRQAVIPLWADHLGLDAATTSIVYGVSGLLDTLLFYPSGKVMDVRGRAFVAVPSMAVLGLAHLLLPLSGGLRSLLAVAVLMGVGNGMGAGDGHGRRRGRRPAAEPGGVPRRVAAVPRRRQRGGAARRLRGHGARRARPRGRRDGRAWGSAPSGLLARRLPGAARRPGGSGRRRMPDNDRRAAMRAGRRGAPGG